MNTLPHQKQVGVISLLVEGCSIRSTERLCQVNRETIGNLALTVGEAAHRLHDALMRDLHVGVLELDELWAMLKKGQRRRKPGDHPDFGDQYTYLGLDAVSKAVIGFATGKRTQATTDAFALDLRRRILSQPQITTDGYTPYAEAVAKAFGVEADFAMIIKEGNFSDVRSSGGPYIVHLTGLPDLAHITTNHVERINLNVRMGCRRFMRKTNAFSKSLRHHRAAIALYVVHHNFCRVHESLRTTPAVVLGIADRVWSVADLIEAAMSVAPAPMAAAPAILPPVNHVLPTPRKAPTAEVLPDTVPAERPVREQLGLFADTA